MFIKEALVPVVDGGTVDDSEFTDGDPTPWIAAFVAAINTARGDGKLSRACVRVSLDLAVRMLGENLPLYQAGDPAFQILQCGAENVYLKVIADPELDASTAIVE